MTIVEIKNQIITHFGDKNSFNIETDGGKIELSEDLASFRADVIKAVMTDLEGVGMIKRIATTQDLWVLTQSFGSFSQNVTISAGVGEVIADQINWFREGNDITDDVCDKTNITESDLLMLCNIIVSILENGDEEPDYESN